MVVGVGLRLSGRQEHGHARALISESRLPLCRVGPHDDWSCLLACPAPHRYRGRRASPGQSRTRCSTRALDLVTPRSMTPW